MEFKTKKYGILALCLIFSFISLAYTVSKVRQKGVVLMDEVGNEVRTISIFVSPIELHPTWHGCLYNAGNKMAKYEIHLSHDLQGNLEIDAMKGMIKQHDKIPIQIMLVNMPSMQETNFTLEIISSYGKIACRWNVQLILGTF
jgi:hypothetical protein